MTYNKSPILLSEGKVTIDGIEVMDMVNAKITFTPDVWTGKVLGERTPSSRWSGGAVTGTITRRRSNKWLSNIVTKYLKNGETLEFKIQGIMNDANSDYYKQEGSITVTCVGCVLTGGIDLASLDTNGGVLEDSIGFNAKDVIF